MDRLRRLVARSRVARGALFAVLFPFFFAVAFARNCLTPMGLSAERGRVKVPWRDVLPLDEMAAALDARRGLPG